MQAREQILNAVFLVLALILSVLLALSARREPTEAGSWRNQGGASGTETMFTGAETVFRGSGRRPMVESPYDAVKGIAIDPNRFKHFGKMNPFETIFPKPTRTPIPAPTAIPPPALADVVAKWQLTGMLGDAAMFTDPDDSEAPSFTLLKGGEPRRKVHGTLVHQIWVIRVDETTYEVELKSDQCPKTHVMKMF
jgi:hypothetical protein